MNHSAMQATTNPIARAVKQDVSHIQRSHVMMLEQSEIHARVVGLKQPHWGGAIEIHPRQETQVVPTAS
jgi:hypothetical protein